MASFTGKKIKDTYKSILKVSDNGELEAAEQEITDGAGNGTGVSLNTSGDVTATGTVAFGSLKDSGEDITIAKFVDEADGIGSNDNDTSIPTSAAVKDYVDTNVTAQDLDITDGTNNGSVDLDSQSLTFTGDAGVSATVSGQTLTLDSSALQSQITSNDSDIAGLDTRLTTAESNISSNDTDIAALQAADTTLQSNIDAEETARIAADSSLQSNITSEASTRAAADTTLQSNIDAEASTRSSADTTLQSNIDSEASTRASADTALQTQITSNDSDISGLDTRLTTAEGNITSNDSDISALDGRLTTAEGNISSNDTDISNLQSSKQDISEKNQANGYAPLDSGAKIPIANLPDSVVGQVEYQGTWNASTNTPTLPSASTVKGHYYVVSTGGTYLSITYAIGDWIISNGTDWEKVDNTDAVTTVFGRLGAIVANESDYSSYYPLISDLTTTNSNVSTNAANIASNDTDISNLQSDKYDKTGGTISGSVTVTGDLTVDTDTLYVDATNNRVGIGTTSPAEELHISATNGAIRVDNNGAEELTIIAGFSTFGNYFQSYNRSGGTYEKETHRATEYIWNGGGGQERMRITQSGRVGIGTSAPINVGHIKTSTNGEGLTLQINSVTEGDYSQLSFLPSTAEATASPIYIRGVRGSSISTSYLTFSTDSTERMRIDSSGNVGIGGQASYSEEKLYVKSGASGLSAFVHESGSGGIRVSGSSSGSGANIILSNNYSTSVADKWAISLDGANDGLAIKSGGASGTERLRITSAGNVGIGTSSPATLLQLNHSGSLSNAIQVGDIDTIGSNTGIYFRTTGNAYISTASTGTHIFDKAGNEKMRITSAGNVGIGTSSVDSKVHIESAFTPSTSTQQLKIENTTTGQPSILGMYAIADNGGAGNAGAIYFDAGADGSSSNNILAFNADHQTDNNYDLVLTGSGNVGIGTSSPNVPLQVQSATGGAIRITKTTTHTDGLYIGMDGNNSYFINYESGFSAFYNNGAERMRIDSSGNVGIGTSSPAYLLDVKGGAGIRLRDDADLRFVRIIPANSTATNAPAQIDSNSSLGFAINVAGSEKLRVISGGGITFNGDTAAANALDDYEEGTFTPEVADAASGGNTASGSFSGKYTKIGNLVHVNYVLGSINTSGMTGGNNIYFRNLPYTITNASGSNPTGSVRAQNVTFNGDYMVAWGSTNSDNFRLARVVNGGADAALTVNAISSGTTDVIVSITYFV